MEISEVDSNDEAPTRRFWEIGKAADEQGRPWSTFWPYASARAAFSNSSLTLRKVLLAGFQDQEMVGCAEISLPMADNTHLAFVEIFTDPACQRQGVGQALFDASVEAVRAEGRRLLSVEVASPLTGEESAGLRFARKNRFTPGLADEMKVVDLFETERGWTELQREAAGHHQEYTLVTWQDVYPAEYVDGYCALVQSFNSEIPTGELDLGAEKWDEARVREKEARFRRADRHEVTTVAVAPNGTLVGLTEVAVSEHVPHLGSQGATLVSAAHRGYRLGVAMKVANHQAVRRAFPDCRHLVTGNADVNEHMNAVNEALGYRSVEMVHEMQREV